MQGGDLTMGSSEKRKLRQLTNAKGSPRVGETGYNGNYPPGSGGNATDMEVRMMGAGHSGNSPLRSKPPAMHI